MEHPFIKKLFPVTGFFMDINLEKMYMKILSILGIPFFAILSLFIYIYVVWGKKYLNNKMELLIKDPFSFWIGIIACGIFPIGFYYYTKSKKKRFGLIILIFSLFLFLLAILNLFVPLFFE